MIDSLKSILPEDQLLLDSDSLNVYGQDWLKQFTPNAMAVALPKTTEQVQALVLWARKNKVGLVPSGGRTGLSAGAVALNQEVIVSFDKMNKILDFNETDQTITCEAGVITEVLQNFAKDKGLFFPVDFAAVGSSQIGGNIATNAGGINVIRYGMFRQWVTSLEVVTGSGEILHLNKGLDKNATGYDFKNLFVGSEGTLGFVTKATLKLTQPPKSPQVFLLAVDEVTSILPTLNLFRSLTLNAFEMFTDKALKHVLHHNPELQSPFAETYPYYLVVDFEGEGQEDKALSLFEQALEKGFISDGVLSQNQTQYKELWKYREDISECISYRSPYKNDVSVKISLIPDFLKTTEEYMSTKFPGFEVVWFGHIGDGNLHINILRPEEMALEDFISTCKNASPYLFKKIQEFDGSISAEHGVGLVKKPFLSFTRSQSEIDFMKQVKSVFDPDHIMNPGKIFDI